MAYNSQYSGEQIEEGIRKSLENLDFNDATVNVDIVDENTPASCSLTKEEGSNRARFEFKIPVSAVKIITDINDGWEVGEYFVDVDTTNFRTLFGEAIGMGRLSVRNMGKDPALGNLVYRELSFINTDGIPNKFVECVNPDSSEGWYKIQMNRI